MVNTTERPSEASSAHPRCGNALLALLDRITGRTLLVTLLAGSLALFLVLIPAPRGDGLLIGSDGIGYFIHVRSVVIDHDLDFANEGEHYRDVFKLPDHEPGSRTPNKYASVGMLLLWLPFYLAAHGVAWTLHALGAGAVPDGYNYLYQAAVCIGSIVYGGLGILFAYRVARRFFAERPSAWAIAVLWLASPFFYYMVFEPSMSHMNSFFSVSALLALWFLRLRDVEVPRWLDFAALGAIGAIMMSVRMQDALFLLIPCAWFGGRVASLLRRGDRRAASRWARGALLAALVAVAVFSLQLYTWYSIYGTYTESPYQHDNGPSNAFSWSDPQLANVLFSSFHGLFSWHPVLLLATAGIAMLWRRDRWFATALLCAFAAQVYLVASWWAWSAGAAFGGRMFLNCGLPWIVGLASLFAWTWERPKWLPALATVSFLLIGWNALSLTQYRLGFVSAEAPLTWQQMTVDRVAVPLKIIERLQGMK